MSDLKLFSLTKKDVQRRKCCPPLANHIPFNSWRCWGLVPMGFHRVSSPPPLARIPSASSNGIVLWSSKGLGLHIIRVTRLAPLFSAKAQLAVPYTNQHILHHKITDPLTLETSLVVRI